MGLFNLFKKNQGNEKSDTNNKESDRYTFFLQKYNSSENRILEQADEDIKKVRALIDKEQNLTKKIFLQSYVKHHKDDCINSLCYFSSFNDKDMTDDLDPLFDRFAEKVVDSQQYSRVDLIQWLVNNHIIYGDRDYTIERQLFDCGIIDKNYEDNGYSVCVKQRSQLKLIIKKARGRSLLSSREKQRLNDYISQRKTELIKGESWFDVLETSESKELLYSSLLDAYDNLISCDTKWEIISSEENLELKSYANRLIEREDCFVFNESFNFVSLKEDVEPPCFEFKNRGISIYIYPEYLIVARSATDFDVVPIKDAEIDFNRQNFVETSDILLPEDAKLVEYTYQYVNKDGSRDARYSNNPRYPVYEYGEIVFPSYNLRMEFSDSDKTAEFYYAVQELINPDETNELYNTIEELINVNESMQGDSVFNSTEVFFDKANEVAQLMLVFYENLKANKALLNAVQMVPIPEEDAEAKLRLLFLADLVKCYEGLGHDATMLNSKEGLAMFLLESQTGSNLEVSYFLIRFRQNELESIVNGYNGVNKQVKELLLNGEYSESFYLDEVFKACGFTELKVQYFSLLYRFFSVIAKADDVVSPKESQWLEHIISYAHGDYSKKAPVLEEIRENWETEASDGQNPMEELQSLIGLSEVKEEVTALANFVKIQKEREKKGMKTVGVSYHCVFTGNPGTGKTTVARILAEIYKDLGIIKKGHLVETDRSGLVAEYVGQTAIKTNKIIDSAMDGVLFIDEAYSLVQGSSNDYGNEAISTLLKRMEDDRDRLIVILAGYSEEMKCFIDSNPGLKSRFNRYIHFLDYTLDELESIFILNAENNQYKLTAECRDALSELLADIVEHKDKSFGNGRFVRNLFEKTIQNQAIRLSKQSKVSVENLTMLLPEDLPKTNVELLHNN